MIVRGELPNLTDNRTIERNKKTGKEKEETRGEENKEKFHGVF